jgi:NADH:ubiquinone reductase (H+-translocating)
VLSLGLPLEHGRLVTEPDMRVRGTRNVWALGDCALVPNAHDGRACPATAQCATRQAGALAKNLLAVMRGAPTKPFRFRPLGMLASIGHRDAVAEILGVHLAGIPAWLAWRGIYLGKLPGLRRKVQVAVDWAWRALFPPSIVELPTARTGPVGRAHYAAGEFVFHKGDAADRFYVIQRGKAGLYLDERRPPIAVLTDGDVFGDTAILEPDKPRPVSIKAEAPLTVTWLGLDDLVRLGPALALRHGGDKTYAALSALAERMPDRSRVPISAAMSRPPLTLSPTLTVNEALGRFTTVQHGYPGYPVVDERGALLGYCRVADLFGALASPSPAEVRVKDVMQQNPRALAEDRFLPEAAVIMHHLEEALPITAADGTGKVVGVLNRFDLLRAGIALDRHPEASGTAVDGRER